MKTSDIKQRVCVVIPAYNEASVIGDVIKNVKNALGKELFDYEVVVINDGSHDNTSSIAESCGATVITHVLNSGAGAATSTGLRYAQKINADVAVTMDADGQHHPEDVILGISKMNDTPYDLLIGSRLIDSEGMSRVKVLGNRGLSMITFFLFGIDVTDSQSGLRVFSKKSLSKLRWRTSGYEFCSEMLWRAKQMDLSVGEYPIRAIYTEYSKQKGQSNWNAVMIVKSLVKRRVVELFE